MFLNMSLIQYEKAYVTLYITRGPSRDIKNVLL
jgi:hypothetical protein